MYEDILMDVTTMLTTLGKQHGTIGFSGQWANKNWMNTPGPLYGGATDNCGTGPLAAPNNVYTDHDGYEVVFRQPVNHYELQQVLDAAGQDPFLGYGADGDAQWSYHTIRAWWKRRSELVAALERRSQEQRALTTALSYTHFAALERWHSYLLTGMHTYLRVYAFFLLEGRIAQQGESLPEV